MRRTPTIRVERQEGGTISSLIHPISQVLDEIDPTARYRKAKVGILFHPGYFVFPQADGLTAVRRGDVATLLDIERHMVSSGPSRDKIQQSLYSRRFRC